MYVGMWVLSCCLHRLTEEYLALVEPSYPSYNDKDTKEAVDYFTEYPHIRLR